MIENAKKFVDILAKIGVYLNIFLGVTICT